MPATSFSTELRRGPSSSGNSGSMPNSISASSSASGSSKFVTPTISAGITRSSSSSHHLALTSEGTAVKVEAEPSLSTPGLRAMVMPSVRAILVPGS